MDLAENAEIALRMVAEAKDIAYDTESSGLDWKINNPIGYVLGAGATHVYVPIRHGGGGNLPGCRPLKTPTDPIEIHPFETALARAFEDRNQPFGRIVGHHIKFDAHMSANAGVFLGRRMACTQNMAAILDEYAREYGLARCAERMGVTAKLGDELYVHMATLFGGKADRNQMQHYWRLAGTDPLGYEYAAGDGLTTWELYWKQLDQIRDEGMGMVTDLENDLIWTIFRMERMGIRVDLEEAENLQRATENRINQLLEMFPPGFNTRSPLQVKAVMEASGHTDWPTTPKHGNPSFTEGWLKKKHPEGEAIVAIRQSQNLINSFIRPLATEHVYNGRVHASLNQLKSDDKGTISGRFSCSDPNLQQVPKHVKALAVPFRKLFVADPDWTFWERDYSQCEPRLFAHYAQEPSLLEGYNKQPFRDMHHVVAETFDVPRDPTAKRMNMGLLTGMQYKTFAAHMNWPLMKAQLMQGQWERLFPGIKGFQQKAKTRLLKRGYVLSILGRRQRLEAPRFAYKGTSKVIQSSNADIMKYKLLHADRMCEDAGDIVRILMTVHDSFNGQYQNTPEAKSLFRDMVAFMESVQDEPFNLSVPFMMDGFEGPNWAVATFGEKAA